ncbi:ABC transporter permease [Albidovulum sp.]|uniref:ABC transporter permease n=1 Tax=Albidovulum sp. TaxID=1872424 RepID=UPI001E0926EE|nr:ABC transporter permease [Paracoccaceae bacterium]MCC0046174.1 ABC transporter permease [Defluviimonas sp.]HPE26208.1 ABC transporter permease [Albidovulum sp.]MCB2132521.1 ABC transporter permease [Paracoccaceae bacterium]MCB2142107.1 ABC transporter permease [Paracoccaceae bacterium]
MTDTNAAIAPPETFRAAVWAQFRKHKGAMFGLVVLTLLVVFVVIGPMLWVPEKLKVVEALKSKNLGPSLKFPMGTDQLGRDQLARMMAAGKVSLAVGFVAMMIAIFLGTFVGVLAGYFKRLDGILMRLTDMFLALPLIPLLLVMVMLFRDKIARVLGPEMGAFILIVFAIGVTSWMHAARIVRGEVLALKEREYVLASRSIGASPRRVILRHILPNVVSPVMVAATLGVAEAIITESVLSFLGLGFPPDFPTWGRLLYEGLEYMQLYPERVIFPGLAISLTVLSVNYIGDGLRDALDPRIRGR